MYNAGEYCVFDSIIINIAHLHKSSPTKYILLVYTGSLYSTVMTSVDGGVSTEYQALILLLFLTTGRTHYTNFDTGVVSTAPIRLVYTICCFLLRRFP